MSKNNMKRIEKFIKAVCDNNIQDNITLMGTSLCKSDNCNKCISELACIVKNMCKEVIENNVYEKIPSIISLIRLICREEKKFYG